MDALKILIPWAIAFFTGIAMTPFLTHYLYKYKMWKKKPGKEAGIGDGNGTPIFNELHKEKDTGTPRMGGIIIWASALFTIFVFWLASFLFPNELTTKLDFMSRSQTWLPLFTLITASLLGLVDDLSLF